MKNSLILILVSSFFMLGLTVGKNKSDALIPQKEMVQVGIIVENVEKSARNWAEFLGLENQVHGKNSLIPKEKVFITSPLI